jgi:predicted outer membrane lipoprotein
VVVAEITLLCVPVAAALAAIAVLWLAKIQEEPRQQKLN